MMRQLRLMLLLSTMMSVAMLAGCGTSGPVDVAGLGRVVGSDLVGARGATEADQRKIDKPIVRLCAVKVLTPAQCTRHEEILAKGRE